MCLAEPASTIGPLTIAAIGSAMFACCEHRYRPKHESAALSSSATAHINTLRGKTRKGDEAVAYRIF